MSISTHNVGSNVYIPVPLWVKSSAVWGGARQEYRYRLSRCWDDSKPTVAFLMMNPSVAAENVDDRTVARCRHFAEDWGYGRLLVGNSFAYRCTDQKRLLETLDPVGPDNDQHLLAMAAEADLIVVAYGKPAPRLRARGIQMITMLRQHGYQLHVLKLSKDGTPQHPLYLPGSLVPVPWPAATTHSFTRGNPN